MATTTTNRIATENLVVAGMGAEGHGVMTGYRASGALTLTALRELAARAGVEEQHMPKAKDAKVQLTRAMRAVASDRGMQAEQEKKKNRQTVEAREPASRWMLVSGGVAGEMPAPGMPYGRLELVATLYDDARGQALVMDPPDSTLAIAVRDEYQRLISTKEVIASDVSKWLNEYHRDVLCAVQYGIGWYVPRAHRAMAESIVAVFWGEASYGDKWMNPPLPVASSEQLSLGLANGLCDEVAEQMKLLADKRAELRAERNDQTAEITARAATSFMVRLNRIGARANAYAALLGDKLLDMCHSRIADMMIDLDRVISGGVTNPDGSFREIDEDDSDFAMVA
jgi:hypothetical protein